MTTTRREALGALLGAGASVATAAQADTVGRTPPAAPCMWLRLTDDRHIVTLHHRLDGEAWTKFDVQMEVYHHNVAGDFLSLRPAIFVAGEGEAKSSHLGFQALSAP